MGHNLTWLNQSINQAWRQSLNCAFLIRLSRSFSEKATNSDYFLFSFHRMMRTSSPEPATMMQRCEPVTPPGPFTRSLTPTMAAEDSGFETALSSSRDSSTRDTPSTTASLSENDTTLHNHQAPLNSSMCSSNSTAGRKLGAGKQAMAANNQTSSPALAVGLSPMNRPSNRAKNAVGNVLAVREEQKAAILLEHQLATMHVYRDFQNTDPKDSSDERVSLLLHSKCGFGYSVCFSFLSHFYDWG